jgi:hypothetical protein
MDVTVCGKKAAALRIHAAVGEHQRQARSFSPPQLAGGAWTVDAAGDAQVLLLAQREIRLDRIDLRHRREERRRADQITNLGSCDGCDPGNERRHLREPEIELRRFDGGGRGLDSRLRREVRLNIVVELALRDGALGGQRPVALEVALGLPELRLRLGETRFSLRQNGLERPGIDFEQHLTLPHGRAFLVGATQQVSRNLRPNLRVDVAVERADPLG